jgi:hypothetical protein
MSTGVLSVFDCKGWLSKSKGVLSKDIPAREGRKVMVESKWTVLFLPLDFLFCFGAILPILCLCIAKPNKQINAPIQLFH